MPSLPLLDESRHFDVLCLGLNACDHLCLIDAYPEPGHKQRISRRVTSGGGQCATAACCLARLGHRVCYGGVCGQDEAGDKAGPWLEEFGVAHLGLKQKSGSGSQQAWIMVRAHDGERTIFWERDESLCLWPEDLDPDLIGSCRVLHLDGHFLEASLAAAEIAKKNGVLVSLDGERVYPGTEKLVGLCDVVVGERSFPTRLTGEKDPDKALAILSEMGPAWVGRTMGHEGAVLLAQGRQYHQEAFKVKVVDTTGAGDIFHAGLIHGILQGEKPEQALETASAVAAISVTELGGRSALPDQAELGLFLENHSS